MGALSEIEWTDHTFNPWIGCTEVSPACDECYARELAARYGWAKWGPGEPRRRTSRSNWDNPRKWNAAAPAFFQKHGRWPRVFCASLADVFDNEVPEEWRADLFSVIHGTPHLRWQLLTKRIGNAAKMLPPGWPDGFGHVGLMSTIANQMEANRDIPKLLAIPATWHGLSCEPLCGPLDLYNGDPDPRLGGLTAEHTFIGEWWEPGDNVKGPPRFGVDWVIAGGESGRRARPVHPDWLRSLRDQCAAAQVPFFFKQWGEFGESEQFHWDGVNTPTFPPGVQFISPDGRVFKSFRDYQESSATSCAQMRRIGKKASGRKLDGRVYDGFPEAIA